MRIKEVEIEHFRCLNHVVIAFDEVTTLIGPNGAGKSTVLRALDWFFNGSGSKPLTADDVWAGATEKRMSVRVEFDQLSEADREELGLKYAPVGRQTFTVWRIWDDGSEKMTGKALAYPPLEHVRAGATATECQPARKTGLCVMFGESRPPG